MSGGKSFQVSDDGAGAIIAIPMSKEAQNRLVICDGLHARKGEDRFHLGREDEAPAGSGIIKRLYSQTIANAEEASSPTIPACKSVHSLQARQAIFTPMKIRLQ